jgi:hypothetical protein
MKTSDVTALLESYKAVSERITSLAPPPDRTSDDQASGGQGPAFRGQGLTTTLLALSTLTLVAVALIIVLVSSASDSTDLRKTIITSLVSILASISGFYFGARTAQNSAQQAVQAVGANTTAPSFVHASPPLSAVQGLLYSYDFTATGSPPPTFQLGDEPMWLKIDPAAGKLIGTPPDTAPFTFTVFAVNSAGRVSAGPFAVHVTPTPTPQPPDQPKTK